MSDQPSSPPVVAPLDLSGGSSYVPPEAGIGDRIKKRRKDLDLSVDELAALTTQYDYEAKCAESSGISRATIYSYESSATKPGTREIRILSEALKISPSILILGEEWDRELPYQAQLGRGLMELLKAATLSPIARPTNASRDEEHFLKIQLVKKQKDK